MKNLLNLAGGLLLILTFTSCDNLAKAIASKIGRNTAKEAIESVSKETSEAISKKAIKKISEEAAENLSQKAVAKSLKEFITSNHTFRPLYENFAQRINKEFADGIIVSSTKNGIEMISKDFPSSAIRMNNNLLIGKGGSLKNAGPMNEFLNHLLPNKKYIVDDAFIYKTDNLGRVVSCTGDRCKAYKTIERNAQRNSDIQKYIVNSMDGRVGLDDGGHLFANNTGGPNELINQVPMSRKLNQHGQWRELERMEEKALKEGKKVFSQRNLLYHGKEKRPYAIEFISKIDGTETRVLVENI